MTLRTRLADLIDPGRTDRETRALKKAMRVQHAVRRADAPLLVVAYEREATILGVFASHRAITVDAILRGGLHGRTIAGYIPTNLALTDARWAEAEATLARHHLANHI